LRRRLETVLEPWELSYKGSEGALRTIAVYEEFVTVENDEEPDAPCVIAHVGEVTQTDDQRTGLLTLIALVYAEDSEQGVRDAENLIEAIETDLIANPWLDERYKLIGPWKTNISGNTFPIFSSTLTCSIEMPAVRCVLGPDGTPLEV
jgi:hypothetical protein